MWHVVYYSQLYVPVLYSFDIFSSHSDSGLHPSILVFVDLVGAEEYLDK